MRKTEKDFVGYLRRHDLKLTAERGAILRETLATDGHFEVEELIFRLRGKGSKVSKATVYRTLPLLVGAGLIREVIHGEKHLHYERTHGGGRHGHLVCVKCGRIIEFEDGALSEMEERICEENHFIPNKFLMEIYGRCRKCR